MDDLLKAGGSLSAYRANKDYGAGPKENSYAWKIEREIERRFHVRHAVAVNSGTAALHCALSALNLRPGDEVVTTPFSFSATVGAILMAGGTPKFADVDPHYFVVTKETVKRVVTKRTRAILPVSLFGGMPDVEGLASFGIPVLEDACQAVGAKRAGRFSGNAPALAAAYSFNGGKNIPAGEAGALVTQSDKVAECARLLMNHGENFGSSVVGLNYRPNEVTCCIAYHGLLELEDRNQRRIDLAAAVDWLTLDIGNRLMCNWPGDGSHVYYVAPFTLNRRGIRRDLFIKRMRRKGITVGAGYIQPPLHKYPAFRKYARGPLPVVEELSSKTLCILSCLTPDKPLSYAEKVAEAMRECLR